MKPPLLSTTRHRLLYSAGVLFTPALAACAQSGSSAGAASSAARKPVTITATEGVADLAKAPPDDADLVRDTCL